MDVKLLKIARKMRHIFSAVLILAMVFVSNLIGQKEVIFPEIAALAIGAWIMEKQMWRANRAQIFAIVTLCAAFGVVAVKILPDIIYLRVAVCFLFCAFCLIFSKTNLVPVISASILPVYFNVTSFVYPLSVGVLSLIISVGQAIMEKFHIRPKTKYIPIDCDFKNQVLNWLKMLVILMIIAVIPYQCGHLFVLAPPMIVTFVIFANPMAPVRKKWFKIWAAIVTASFLGASAVYLTGVSGISIYITLAIALIAVYFVFNKLKVWFAPAGAMALVPLLLQSISLQKVLFFPLEVAIGALILIGAAFLFKKKA